MKTKSSVLTFALRSSTCLAMTGAVAAMFACNDEPLASGPEKTGAAADAIEAPPIHLFGNSELTQQRAEQIVEDAGFTYLDHAPCPGNAHHCTIFTVLGNGTAPKIFAFQVVDDACTEPVVPFDPNAPPLGRAKRCFGGYTTLTRSVVTPSIAIAPDLYHYGAAVQVELQTINDNREWETQKTIVSGRVQQPVYSHGVWTGDEEIVYFEARNRLGLLVDSGDESTISVPSSTPLTDAQRCAVLGHAFEDYPAFFEEHCPFPDFSIEPFDVEFPIPTCDLLSTIATTAAWAESAALEAACNAAPNCVLRGHCSNGLELPAIEPYLDILVGQHLAIDG